MTRTRAVESSYLQSLKFDELNHILTVRFQDGCVTNVFDVSTRTYQAILNADSPGAKFTELITNKDYKFTIVKAAA